MSNESVHGNVGGDSHSRNRGDDRDGRGAPRVWDDQMQQLMDLIANMGNRMNQMATTQQQIVTQLAQQQPVANEDRRGDVVGGHEARRGDVVVVQEKESQSIEVDDDNDWKLECKRCLGHGHLEFQCPNEHPVKLINGVPIIIEEDEIGREEERQEISIIVEDNEVEEKEEQHEIFVVEEEVLEENKIFEEEIGEGIKIFYEDEREEEKDFLEKFDEEEEDMCVSGFVQLGRWKEIMSQTSRMDHKPSLEGKFNLTILEFYRLIFDPGGCILLQDLRTNLQ